MSGSDVCADVLSRARGWKQEPSWAIIEKSLKIGTCVEPLNGIFGFETRKEAR